MKNKTWRNDFIVLTILLIIVGGLFLFNSHQLGEVVEIIKDHKVYGTYSLNTDQIIKIKHENTIQIKNHQVQMIDATCENHLCIKQGKISKKGETIVCLPHRLIIEIKEGEEGLDGKVY